MLGILFLLYSDISQTKQKLHSILITILLKKIVIWQQSKQSSLTVENVKTFTLNKSQDN